MKEDTNKELPGTIMEDLEMSIRLKSRIHWDCLPYHRRYQQYTADHKHCHINTFFMIIHSCRTPLEMMK